MGHVESASWVQINLERNMPVPARHAPLCRAGVADLGLRARGHSWLRDRAITPGIAFVPSHHPRPEVTLALTADTALDALPGTIQNIPQKFLVKGRDTEGGSAQVSERRSIPNARQVHALIIRGQQRRRYSQVAVGMHE